jgi:hypothetical protein
MQAAQHGDRIGGVAPLTRICSSSLLFIDPLTALLLLVMPRAGLILCVAVVVTDVAHNFWFALHRSIRMELYLSQIVFLLFVVFTVRMAWSREPACRAARYRFNCRTARAFLRDCLFIPRPHVPTTHRHQRAPARLDASVSRDEPQNPAMGRRSL